MKTLGILILAFLSVSVWAKNNSRFEGLQICEPAIESVWAPFLETNHCTYVLLEADSQIWIGGSEWHGHRVRLTRDDGTSVTASFMYHLSGRLPDGSWERVDSFTLKREFMWDNRTGWQERLARRCRLSPREWMEIPTLDIEFDSLSPRTEAQIRDGYLKQIGSVAGARWDHLLELLNDSPEQHPVLTADDCESRGDPSADKVFDTIRQRLAEVGLQNVIARTRAVSQKCSWAPRNSEGSIRTSCDYFVLPLPDSDAGVYHEVLDPVSDYCSLYIVRNRGDSTVIQAELRIGAKRLIVLFLPDNKSDDGENPSSQANPAIARLADCVFAVEARTNSVPFAFH